MKVFVGDKVLVTAGRDKGMTGEIAKIFPKQNKVIVSGANMYSKHVKPRDGQPGEIRKVERPLDMGKIAVLNEKGRQDRIGFEIKGGTKTRIFKKSGAVAPVAKAAKKK